jgi:hypothetical protein
MPAEPRELTEYKTDHDLLVELRVLMTELRRDMRDMKDGTGTILTDHETRLRSLEATANALLGKQSIIAGAIGIAAGLVGSFIQSGKI